MLLVQQQQVMQNLDKIWIIRPFFGNKKAKMFWFKDRDCVNSNVIQRLVDGDLVFEDPKDIEEHIIFLIQPYMILLILTISL